MLALVWIVIAGGVTMAKSRWGWLLVELLTGGCSGPFHCVAQG